jgi:hypothetical protein
MPAKQLEASVRQESGVAVIDLSCPRPQRLLWDGALTTAARSSLRKRSADQKEMRQCG